METHFSNWMFFIVDGFTWFWDNDTVLLAL